MLLKFILLFIFLPLSNSYIIFVLKSPWLLCENELEDRVDVGDPSGGYCGHSKEMIVAWSNGSSGHRGGKRTKKLKVSK
jgi:hypothetical protein